ncbi:MAG: hypothetical protein KAT70_05675, partial [Thermoplasmata archaeon]|nr:hypothetical protein [Thermoplasmata archaeon]
IQASMPYDFRFYAVRTNPKREKRVAEDISRIAKRMKLDVSQVLHHPTTKGYVYVECRSQQELERMLKMVPSHKGIVGEIPPDQIEELFAVEPSLDEIKEYEKVVVSQGPDKGTVGVVERIDGKEAVIMVEDPIMPRRIIVPLGRLERKD